jgi:hypothetical protein
MKKRVALLMLLCKWAQLKQAWRAKKNGSRELTNSLLLSTLLPSKIYAASFCPEVVDKIVCSRQEKQWSF